MTAQRNTFLIYSLLVIFCLLGTASLVFGNEDSFVSSSSEFEGIESQSEEAVTLNCTNSVPVQGHCVCLSSYYGDHCQYHANDACAYEPDNTEDKAVPELYMNYYNDVLHFEFQSHMVHNRFPKWVSVGSKNNGNCSFPLNNDWSQSTGYYCHDNLRVEFPFSTLAKECGLEKTTYSHSERYNGKIYFQYVDQVSFGGSTVQRDYQREYDFRVSFPTSMWISTSPDITVNATVEIEPLVKSQTFDIEERSVHMEFLTLTSYPVFIKNATVDIYSYESYNYISANITKRSRSCDPENGCLDTWDLEAVTSGCYIRGSVNIDFTLGCVGGPCAYDGSHGSFQFQVDSSSFCTDASEDINVYKTFRPERTEYNMNEVVRLDLRITSYDAQISSLDLDYVEASTYGSSYYLLDIWNNTLADLRVYRDYYTPDELSFTFKLDPQVFPMPAQETSLDIRALVSINYEATDNSQKKRKEVLEVRQVQQELGQMDLEVSTEIQMEPTVESSDEKSNENSASSLCLRYCTIFVLVVLLL